MAVRSFIPGIAPHSIRSVRSLTMTLIAVSLTMNRPVHADKITSMLTARDLAHPIVLDANGQMPTAATSGRNATTPTYVAYALLGGEHLASDLTTLSAPSSSSSSVSGPLNLTPALETSLDSALSASGSAIVQTDSQQYLVAYLPRYDVTVSTSSKSTSSTGTSSSTGNILGFNNINGVSFSKISQYLNAAPNEVAKLSTTAINDLGKLLSINNAKRSPTRPSLNLALHSPTTGSSTAVTASTNAGPSSIQEAQVLEVPAPEPSTWIFFSIVLGVLFASGRSRKRRRVEFAS